MNRIGSVANLALNFKSLSCNLEIISVSGKDANGKNLTKKLKDKKLTVILKKVKKQNTFKKTTLTRNSQQILRIDEEEKSP